MSKEDAGGKNPDFQLQPNADRKPTPETAPVAAVKTPLKVVMPPGQEQYALDPVKNPDKNMAIEPGKGGENYRLGFDTPGDLKLNPTVDQYGQAIGPNVLVKDTGAEDLVDMTQYATQRGANEDMVIIKSREVIEAELRRKAEETQKILDIQNAIIYRQQVEEAKLEAERAESQRKAVSVTRLTSDQMKSFKERQAKGGGIQLKSNDEYQAELAVAEKRRLQITQEAERLRNANNPPELQLVPVPAEKQKAETQPSAKLMQRGISVDVNLHSIAEDDQLANRLQEYRTTKEPQQIKDYKANVMQHLNEDPAAVIRKYGLEDYVKPEDIRAEGRANVIDPQKVEQLFDGMRIYHMTDDLFGDIQQKVESEISKENPESLNLYDAARASVHKYAESVKPAEADAETTRLLKGFKLRFDSVQTELKKKFAEELKKQSDPELFLRTKAAELLIAQADIHKILPDVTAEQFLAVMSVQESFDASRTKLRGQIHEWYKKKYMKQEEAEQKKQTLETPMMVKIKKEDIVSPTQLDALLAEYNSNPTPALEQELAEYTSHTDNREKAIAYYGLTGLIQPDDIRTDNRYEITEAVDNDRKIFFQNAIRLKHIVHDRLNEKVDSIVKAELGSKPSSSIDAYNELQAFIAEKNPDVTEDDKRLLQQYYTGFGEMVNQEIKKQSLIFKDQERVFIDIGKHKATRIPARVILSTARKVAAERFVRANQAQLPESMTAEQFLAGISVADTYRFSEDKLKEEVFEWYRKNKPRIDTATDEGGDRQPRRRVQLPFLRRGQAPPRPTSPETPPAPQPPTAPGNPPENTPPGGSPPPEPPPARPAGGGAAAGGAPSPDNQPPTGPPGDDEDTVQVIVPAPVDDAVPDARPGEPPTQNTVENAQPAAPTRRSLRNELTPRKLSEQAVKLYKKSKERAQKAVKLAYEGSPYEISEGLLRSAVKVQDVETSQLIEDNDFLNKLNDYREIEGADIRSKVEDMDGEDILDQWGLEGHFDAETVKDRANRDQLLDAIYIREISLAIFQANEEAFQAEVKKVSPQSLEQVQKFSHTVTEFIPQYLDEVANFQMDMLGRKMNLNPITAAQYMNQERLRIATKMFEDNKFIMPDGATPEQFLAALSVVETFYQINNEIFNDLYEVYDQKEHPQEDSQEHLQERPATPAAAVIREKSSGKKLLNYDEKNGLLRTPIRIRRLRLYQFGGLTEEAFVQNIEKRKQNDNFVAQLQQFAATHNLYQIAGEYGLGNYFTRNRIRDTEEFRNSQELIDLIIVKQASDNVFATNQDILIGQLRNEHVPSKTLEAWHQLKDLPNNILNIYLQRVSNARSDLYMSGVKHAEQKLNNQRIDITRKIFEENQFLMPEGSTPEQLLAAFSIQETLSNIKNRLFDDLNKAYLDSKNSGSDDEEDDNPSGNPTFPSSGSGGSGSGGPAPTPTPDQGGGTHAAASSAPVAEAEGPENQKKLSDVRYVEMTGASPQLKVSRIEDIQARLKNLQAAVTN